MSRNGFDEMSVLRNLSTGTGLQCDQAYHQLWDQYHQQVYRSARKFFRTGDDAEEATQDVFLAIWVSRPHLAKLQEGEFVKYLHGVQRNVMARTLIKVTHREQAQAGFAQATTQHEDATDFRIREQQVKKVYQLAVDGFPQERRQVFELAINDGKSYTEIAEVLNISSNTVSYHLKNSYKALRQVLKPFTPVILTLWNFLIG